jgi:AAA ATPase domain
MLLLEREGEVAAFEALADGARSGGGRFVVIEGSAGIGKTRLLAEARAIAGAAGMGVLAARGGELEGGFAYGIVRQLFEPLLAAASPELRAELLSGPAALTEPLFGASQVAALEDTPAEGSFAILHGLYWLAANAAFQQPTLLAIDDLHWADTPSSGQPRRSARPGARRYRRSGPRPPSARLCATPSAPLPELRLASRELPGRVAHRPRLQPRPSRSGRRRRTNRPACPPPARYGRRTQPAGSVAAR